MNFTAEQKKAAEAYGHGVCVRAGAGSGKTAVLVHRFIHEVIRRDARVGEVLAITFTQKATFEMKRRIADAFRREGRTEELRDLESAYISTIDGFCARVLRENPIEAGVDPDFTVMEESDALLIRDQILDDVLEELCQDGAFREFLFRFSIEGVEEAVKEIYEKGRARGQKPGEFLSVESNENRKVSGERLIEALEVLSKLSRASEKRKAMSETLDTFRTALRRVQGEDVITWEDIETLRALSTPGKISLPRGAGAEDLHAAVNAFREARELYFDILLEERTKEPMEKLKQVALAFEAKYDAWKKERRKLDFEDLLVACYGLLSSTRYGVGADYRKRFKLILVDEFQDTSPLQDRMISYLSSGSNLFIVGDDKQAIYGFRNARAALFGMRAEALKKAHPEKGLLQLAANFRSSRTLIDFFNTFFSRIWNEANDGLAYVPLTPGLPSPAPRKSKESLPAVEWLLAGLTSRSKAGAVSEADEEEESTGEGDDGEASMRAKRYEEAQLLTRRLARLVTEEKRMIRDAKSGEMRPCRYGDMAVLFRTRTALSTFVRAFREANIPHYVAGGRGFFERPEIRDALGFLAILENPTYDIPLAGVLRSPLVGLSDDGLYLLGRSTQDGGKKAPPLFSALDHYRRISGLSQSDAERIERFMAYFTQLREEKHRLSVADLIGRLLRVSGYDLLLIGDENGTEKWANLRKLMDMAHRFQTGDGGSHGDFLRRIKEGLLRGLDEAEADVTAEGDDAVRLMTIHQAKGLEFPIVVIADMGYIDRGRENSFAAIDREGRPAIKVRNPLSRAWEKGYSYKRVSEEARAEERAESARLFYVAATRARDLLIFSGTAKEKALKSDKPYAELAAWTDWLRKATGLYEFEGVLPEQTVQIDSFPIRLLTALPPPAVKKEALSLAEEPEFRAHFVHGKVAHNALSVRAADFMKRVTLIKRPFFETVSIPVTALLTYETCPRLFYYRHILQMPELGRGAYDDPYDIDKTRESEEELSISRTDLGTLVHAALEQTPFDHRFSEEISRRLLKWRELLGGATGDVLSALFNRFYESEAFDELRRASWVAREFPFSLRLPHGMLRGAIDLMYKTEDGRLVVADYKTNNIEEKNLEEKAEHYRTQIMVYALALRALKKEIPQDARLIFLNERFTRTVSFSIKPDQLDALEEKIDHTLEAIIREDFAAPAAGPCALCITKETCCGKPDGSATLVAQTSERNYGRSG